MDIKWTAGPGPAPLPYSKRAREAMGYSDDDKPWAHPDPPAAESMGFTTGDVLTEGRLRTGLFMSVIAVIILIWAYRRIVKRDRNPFFSETPSASADVKVSAEATQKARDARIKRFENQKSSYAEIMREAAGGWTPDTDGSNTSKDVVESPEEAPPSGLRYRGQR